MKMCLSVYIKVCFVKVSTFHTCYPPPFSSSSSSSRRHSCKWEFSHSCRATHRREVTDDRRDSPSFYIHSPVVLVFFGDGQTSANVAPFEKKTLSFFLFCLMIFDWPLFFLNFVPTAHDVATFFIYYLFNLIYWIENLLKSTWTRDSVSPMRIAISSRMKMSG